MVIRIVTQFDKLGLIYLSTTKVANTSIKHALMKAEGIGEFDSPHAEGIPIRVARIADALQKRKEFITFAFVRNPWDRLLSCWSDKCGPDTDVDMRKYGIFPGMSFESFVDIVCGFTDKYSEIHFRSQSYYLIYGGKLVPSFIGRFENLISDWSVLQAIVSFKRGIELPDLPKMRSSDHGLYREYYSRRMAMIVENRYQTDVNLFGYSF